MKKRLLAVTILSALAANASLAETTKPVADNKTATAKNAAGETSINAIIQEIAAAAQSGDEQLVAKLLNSAIQSNPQIADKIVAAFVASQSAISTNGKGGSINVASVINNVVASLQNQPGSEALVASVLSSYTPAAGGDKKNNSNNNNNNNNNPPSLPNNNGQVGNNNNNNNPPKENPKRISAN